MATWVTFHPQSSKPSSTLRNGPTNPWSKSNSPSLHPNQCDSDGADVELAVEGAEEPLDVFESLVAQHHIVAFEGLFGQAGAQHVDAVEGGLGGDRVVVAGERERFVGDGEGEVFGHLV